MIPRRNEEGWRLLGPFTWKVEREDHHGDQSTTTTLTLILVAHWTLKIGFTRHWKDDE